MKCWFQVKKEWRNIEYFEKRITHICCVQEVWWKGQGARMIGNGLKFLEMEAWLLVTNIVYMSCPMSCQKM